jgi:hypothetical protein
VRQNAPLNIKKGITMTNFTNAIQHNWADYVIAPGASRMDCCVDHTPDCTACDGDGYDEHNTDCYDCKGTGNVPVEDISDEELQIWDEGSFSWSECDSCGSTLGGSRYPAHAINKEAFGPDAKRPDDVHHIDICTDCLMFHANGDTPDEWAATLDELSI